jgi:D-sedoheptulose 7-phosphate isomerase
MTTKDEKLLRIKTLADESAILRKSVADQLGQQLLDLAALFSGVIGSGGKIITAGNGGSAAEASHFATEMIVRLTAERNRQSLPAICINVDTSVLTAAANDYGFDNVFARQVEGLANKGDLLFVFSTSGNSKNLVKAVQTARDKNVLTAAMLGGKGGELVKIVDRALVVPHPSTQRIQEEHLFLLHMLVELIEGDLFG